MHADTQTNTHGSTIKHTRIPYVHPKLLNAPRRPGPMERDVEFNIEHEQTMRAVGKLLQKIFRSWG